MQLKPLNLMQLIIYSSLFELERIEQAVNKVKHQISNSNEIDHITSEPSTLSMQQDDRQENEDQTVLPIEMNERIYVIEKMTSQQFQSTMG